MFLLGHMLQNEEAIRDMKVYEYFQAEILLYIYKEKKKKSCV